MKKRLTHILLGISITAFVIRAAAGIDLFINDPFSGNPPAVTDMATYINSAWKIIKLNYSELFYYQPFYYAVFLPLTILMGCGSLMGPIIVQAALGAATVYIAGISCAKIFGKKAAVITALLTAFNNVLTAYTAYCLIEILQAFWLALIFLLALKAMEKKSYGLWMTLGTVTGLSILTRGNVWFLVPGLAVAAIYCGLKSGNRKYMPLTLLVIFILIPQIPFSAWNSFKLGKFTGPSTAGPVVLALGNTPEAPPAGKDPGAYGPGPMEYPLSFHAWMSDMEKVSVPSRIFQWFRKEPLAYLELTFRKMLLFWDWREVPNNIEIKYNCGKGFLYRYLPLLPNAFIIFPAFAALIAFIPYALKKRNGRMLLLFYFITAYWLATAAFYILGRFRLPSLPLMAIASGAFIYFIFHSVIKKKRAAFYPLLIIMFFAAFIVFAGYDFYRCGFEKSIMKSVRPNGVRVGISPNSAVYLDNGPVTCGGWVPKELKNGDIITKRFMPEEKGPFHKSQLSLRLLWEGEGSAEFETDGMPFLVKSGAPGLREHEIPVRPESDNTVRIRLRDSTAKIFCIIDFQRDYGRTAFNGTVCPGELVCSLSITR